jgi:hypothetical protein
MVFAFVARRLHAEAIVLFGVRSQRSQVDLSGFRS